ncbi:MAG TPA: sporulation integral membrane protein YlbJ [Bacillota bacterium]|mgnify:CR=1 FL=1|nr:sporulation integral membrane protein YlbJ [Bacillota bacterium]
MNLCKKKPHIPELRRRDLLRLLWTACTLVLVAGMVIYPQIVFEGAAAGLKAWWNIVFPSLLPFFIASELLTNFGVVHFMGILLEPVMRPLFNVPGAGSFVVAVGYTSGYPIGSMVTAKLRSRGLCTRVEAERLISFTNNSSPLFMLVAVAVGMFDNASLGVIIAGAHYLANLTIGLGLRFYAHRDTERIPGPSAARTGLVSRAFNTMLQVQREDGRPLGRIMGEAVRNSITNLLNIGGFIIFFAVFIKMLTAAGIIETLAGCLGIFLLPLGFSPEILPALASGIFEMTIGSKLASEAAAPLLQQVVAVGMILAWSGLSVHAQVASMISETDIRIRPFVISRAAHACLAGIYTCIAYKWAEPPEALAVTAAGAVQAASFSWLSLKMFGFFIALLAVLILLALLYHLAGSLKLLVFKKIL